MGPILCAFVGFQAGGIPGLNHKMVIQDPKARGIVQRMFSVYAKCKTYRDTGTYTSGQAQITFRTFYRRPNRIYFEFNAKDFVRDGKFVFWTSGARKKIYRMGVDGPGGWDDSLQGTAWYGDTKKTQKDETLSTIEASFTGISAGTACNITNLLFPTEAGNLSFSDMEDLKYGGIANIRGKSCDILTSKKYSLRAWVDRKSHLLLRIKEPSWQKNSWEQTDIKPEINVSIADKNLTFQIPN